MPMDNLAAEEKLLLEWKDDNAAVYYEFKQSLEKKLAQPYHQILLDMGDGNAGALQYVSLNLGTILSKDGFDFDKLYSKAVENNDVPAYCLCCYILFDEGADKLLQAAIAKTKDPGAREVVSGIWKYRRFCRQSQKRETENITTDELNLLALRRWHYDHQEEYAEFLSLFQKSYDGDMTFIQNNFFFLMEILSFNGIRGIVKIVSGFFPGNKHHVQSLMDSEENPLRGSLSEMLDSTLNNDAVRERLLHKNPYLLSLYYWIVFDNGFLHAADLISHTFLKADSPYWEKIIGRRCVEALIGASILKGQYSKGQWKEFCKQLKKGDVKKVIDDALREVKGRRGRKSKVVLIEEMLPTENVSALTVEIEKILSEWKHLEGTDVILPYIFAAMVRSNLANKGHNYRTFHAAMQEKFPSHDISNGFNWAEAVYNALISEGAGNVDITESQIQRGKKHVTDIKLRLLSAVNPNIK